MSVYPFKLSLFQSNRVFLDLSSRNISKHPDVWRIPFAVSLVQYLERGLQHLWNQAVKLLVLAVAWPFSFCIPDLSAKLMLSIANIGPFGYLETVLTQIVPLWLCFLCTHSRMVRARNFWDDSLSCSSIFVSCSAVWSLRDPGDISDKPGAVLEKYSSVRRGGQLPHWVNASVDGTTLFQPATIHDRGLTGMIRSTNRITNIHWKDQDH